MIILNGYKFAETKREFINTLATSGGTAIGFYKRNLHSVDLFNVQKKQIGVINKYGVICSLSEIEGKKIYSYSLPQILQLKPYSLLQQRNDIEGIAIKTTTFEFNKGDSIFRYL